MIGLYWVALLAAGCGSGGDHAASRDSTPPGSAAAPPWQVTVGSRGGFTGGGAGHIVASDGRVIRWSQLTPADSTTHELVGRANPAALATLAACVAAPELQALKLQDSGNMTAFLEWRSRPRVLRWSWPESGAEVKLPAPLRRAHDAALAAVESARAAQSGGEENR